MEMMDDILKYIKNEKDISRYQISMIERRESISPSQKRILCMEREFVELPLESMSFEDVADVAAAISIYKTSRGLFYKTYSIEPPKLYKINKAALINSLLEKRSFIEKTAQTLVHTRVQELNLVQNSDFYYDFAKRQSIKNGTTIDLERRALDSMSLKALLGLEPLTIAKKRARSQAVTYSIGRYLSDSLKDIEINDSLSVERLKEVNEDIDSIISNLKRNRFAYYNEGLRRLPNLLKGTMGENPYLCKLHPLQNVFDFSTIKKFKSVPKPISHSEKFESSRPVLGNIFFGAKKTIVSSASKDSERNIQNKTFGILFPIPRRGNEKMTLLYKEIYLDGFNISHLFSENLSNIKALSDSGESYYKGLLLHPLWKIIGMASTDNTSRYLLSKLLRFNEDDFNEINFDDKDLIERINEVHTGFISLSKNSKILTSKTRSEEEGISDIFSIINSRVSEIKSDYSKLIITTNELL